MMEEFDISVNNAEVADLQTDSVNENEGLDTNIDNDNNDDNDSDTSSVDDTGVSVENSEVAKPKQTVEDNAIAAAARREAEAKANDLLKQQNEFAQSYGYSDFAEMQIAAQQQKEAELIEQYENAGINPALVNQLIDANPVVQQAKEIAKQQQIQSDIANLHNEIQGTQHIKTVNDLYALPKWKEMYGLIARGYELSDAYFKVHKAEILTKQGQAIHQKAVNDINGKSHIRGDGSGVDVSKIQIDPAEFKIAKLLDPSLTKEAYIKFKKQLT